MTNGSKGRQGALGQGLSGSSSRSRCHSHTAVFWQGVLLGFVRAVSEFGATIVVAGNIPGKTQTLPLAIYQNVQLGRDSEAMTLVAISIALAVVALAVHNWLLARANR